MSSGEARAALNAPAHIDWGRVYRSSFLIYQRFHYEYPAPIRDLQHRLMIVPPPIFGNQRLTLYHLDISRPGLVTTKTDQFSNTVVDFQAPLVEGALQFEAWIAVEREGDFGPRLVPGFLLEEPALLNPTPKTTADRSLLQAAEALGVNGAIGLDLAEEVNRWVHNEMTYARGVTDVHTTAAQALALKQGVCQDYAHIMLALCRTLGFPSLYVSGHLLGEGGTHAWVEVLVPARGDTNRAEAWAFDPTHGRRARPSYVSVAIGRDYSDVAPTSGSYKSMAQGRLSVRKKVRLTDIAYGEPEA